MKIVNYSLLTIWYLWCLYGIIKSYEVEIRQPKSSNSMQYLRGFSTIKNLSALSIEQCIGYIPYWIRYIKYCKRN